MPAMAEAAHAAGALLIAAVDPLSLAVLHEPGSYGADMAVGDGQVLGVPMQFGGPAFGFMVVTEAAAAAAARAPGRPDGRRRRPPRLRADAAGARAAHPPQQGEVQHLLEPPAGGHARHRQPGGAGPAGLREMAEGSVRRAHQLADALRAAGGRVVRGPLLQRVRAAHRGRRRHGAAAAGRARPARRRAGRAEYGLGHAVTLAATELTTDAGIAALVAALRDIGELGAGAARPRRR
jgi:glycine dehydrogenase subunit 1